MKAYLIFVFLLLFLSACQKVESNIPEPTVDWESWGNVMIWTETESKTGDSDWKKISEGKNLTFFYNPSVDQPVLPERGAYNYKPSININIKVEAYFERTKSTLLFLTYSAAKADTTILAYRLYDSSTLLIKDTTVTPIIEIKYRRKI